MGSVFSKPKTPKPPPPPPPPKPIAPETKKEAPNVKKAVESSISNRAKMTGRKQANILDPSSALKDEEQDILG